MKISWPGLLDVTSARAVPSAAESGTQSAPVARSSRSLESAYPDVVKSSVSE